VVVYGIEKIESDDIYQRLHLFGTGICVMKTFLLTSLELDKTVFTLKRPSVKLVLYEIHADMTSNYSQSDANTVLFSLGTTFTIESIEKLGDIWKLTLTLSKVDPHGLFSGLFEKFNAEIKDEGELLFKFGSSLLDMGEIDKAKWLFHQVIERRTSCSVRVLDRMYWYLHNMCSSHDNDTKAT
jgi:hypothetical protein